MTARKKDLALDLLEMALAQRHDASVLATVLIALDNLADNKPEHATAHYAAGRVLLLMGKSQLAMGAFRVATRRDPRLALAHYFEGVTHWLLGDDQEALAKMARARALEPELMEAFYDAGQIHYERRDYRGAARLFEQALARAPGDLLTTRKLLAAQIGMGQWEAARQTHAAVRAIWANATSPAIRALRSYVLDQFDVGPIRVVAVETFEPVGDPAVLYAFAATLGGKTVFSVNLETSQAAADAGFPWVLTVCEGELRASTDLRYRDQPGYQLLRPTVARVVRRFARIDGVD